MTRIAFFETEEAARTFVAGLDRRSTAEVTPWSSDDPAERMRFVVWYETDPQPVRYEVREVDAWPEYETDDPDEVPAWTYNSTHRLGEFATASEDVGRAMRRYLRRHYGVTFHRGRTRTEYSGDVWEIVDRATREPLFVAVPME